MTQDEFIERERREKYLWRRWPRTMAALAPGDLPDYPSAEQRLIHAELGALYRSVLSGDLTPKAARRLRREIKP